MSQIKEPPQISSPRPELEEEDYNAPFLHETTSLTQVVFVLATLVLTLILLGVVIYMV